MQEHNNMRSVRIFCIFFEDDISPDFQPSYLGDQSSERNRMQFPDKVRQSSVVSLKKVAPAMARKWTGEDLHELSGQPE